MLYDVLVDAAEAVRPYFRWALRAAVLWMVVLPLVAGVIIAITSGDDWDEVPVTRECVAPNAQYPGERWIAEADGTFTPC